MDTMHTSVTREFGQLVNDLAEEAGCDYGPVLGALAAHGLFMLGRMTGRKSWEHAAARQWLAAAQLGAGQPPRSGEPFSSPLPF